MIASDQWSRGELLPGEQIQFVEEGVTDRQSIPAGSLPEFHATRSREACAGLIRDCTSEGVQSLAELITGQGAGREAEQQLTHGRCFSFAFKK